MKRLALLATLALSACPKAPEGPDVAALADGHYLAGQAAYLKGDFAVAHQEFEEVRKLNATEPRLPAAEGELYLAEVKVPEAIAAFEEAARRDPKRGTTWSRLAYLYVLKGEMQKANEAVTKALAANPRDANALETQGDLLLKDGKVDEAVQAYVKASQSCAEKVRGELVQRATAELVKRGRGADALAVLDAAVQRGVKTAEVLNELGDRRVEAGQLDAAIVAYTDAAQVDLKDPTLWELVGELEARQGRPEKALAAYKASLAVKERGVVHVALARLCQTQKDVACVTRELDQALQTASGEELRETIDLSELLVSVGRQADALTLLKTVSEEPEQKGNQDLQLRTARLARDLGNKAVMNQACVRATAGAKATRCP